MLNIHVSNVGFGNASPASIPQLSSLGNVTTNQDGVRYTEKDMLEKLRDSHVLIAGTEPITRKAIEQAPNLRLIARVGVGLDNVDLVCAQERKISVCYTPDAPALSVPEFTLAIIMNLVKGIGVSDRSMHQGVWIRPMGRMLSSLTFGVVGAGRIGSNLIKLLHFISPAANIVYYDPYITKVEHAQSVSLQHLFENSDVISLHIPSVPSTRGLINEGLLKTMKKNGYIVNTSRGDLLDEEMLVQLLQSKSIAGAAFDVYHQEPYNGPLQYLDNCLLTSHIGSMTQEVRSLMETQVVEDVMRFAAGQTLLRSAF